MRLPPSPAHSSGCLPAEPGRCGRHSCGGRRNCQMRRSVFWEEQEEEEAKKSPLSSVITHSLLSLVASRPTFTTTTTSRAVPPCLPLFCLGLLCALLPDALHNSRVPLCSCSESFQENTELGCIQGYLIYHKASTLFFFRRKKISENGVLSFHTLFFFDTCVTYVF